MPERSRVQHFSFSKFGNNKQPTTIMRTVSIFRICYIIPDAPADAFQDAHNT